MSRGPAKEQAVYLVTGGAGFIGSNLVAALAALGHEVLVVDRLRDGPKWRNLATAQIAGILPPEAVARPEPRARR